MYPVLFKLPWLDWPINSYGFSIMIGFLLSSWVAVRRGKPLGLKSDFILDVGIIGMIFGIIGAKVNYLLQYGQEVAEHGKLSLWGDMGLNPLGALLLGPIPFAFWFWRTKKAGQPVRLISWQNGVLMFLTFLFAFVGTRALYLYQNHAEYSWKLFKNWQSGFVLYGGVIAGGAASLLYIKMRGQPVALVADLVAAPVMLAQAFGRIGCFLNGCCHGKQGTGFTAITFPVGSPPAEKTFAPTSVYPTQLYEAAATVGFFFLLSWVYKRPRKAQGEVFLMMIMLYAVWRFIIEFFRGDERPLMAGLFYSQWIGLIFFAGAGIWLYLIRSRAPAAPAGPGVEKGVPQPSGT